MHSEQLSGEGSMAVAVGVGDRWQVICDIFLTFFFVIAAAICTGCLGFPYKRKEKNIQLLKVAVIQI